MRFKKEKKNLIQNSRILKLQSFQIILAKNSARNAIKLDINIGNAQISKYNQIFSLFIILQINFFSKQSFRPAFDKVELKCDICGDKGHVTSDCKFKKGNFPF